MKNVVPFKNSKSDTRSRTFEVGDGTTTLIKKLDRKAAKHLILVMRTQVKTLRDLIYQFDVGKGWEALGYHSLHECFQKELIRFYSASYLYRESHAARIEHNLGELLPVGKMVPERVLRPLHGLKPKQQRKAWKRACKATKNEIPTSSAIEKAVAKLSSKSSPKAKAERTGTVKLREKAKEKMEALGKQIVADHGRLFVQELIKWLNQHLPPRRATQS